MDNNIIYDDTIVEFAYDRDKNRWIPLRNRHDKTISYRRSKETRKIIFDSIKTLVESKRNHNTDFVDGPYWKQLKLKNISIKRDLNIESYLKLIDNYHNS